LQKRRVIITSILFGQIARVLPFRFFGLIWNRLFTDCLFYFTAYQIQLIYRARLLDPDVRAGEETAELDLFEWDDIPWREIAFPSVHWALQHFDEVRQRARFAPHTNPAGSFGDLSELERLTP